MDSPFLVPVLQQQLAPALHHSTPSRLLCLARRALSNLAPSLPVHPGPLKDEASASLSCLVTRPAVAVRGRSGGWGVGRHHNHPQLQHASPGANASKSIHPAKCCILGAHRPSNLLAGGRSPLPSRPALAGAVDLSAPSESSRRKGWAGRWRTACTPASDFQPTLRTYTGMDG